MSAHLVFASWDDRRSPVELIEASGSTAAVDFVVLGTQAGPAVLDVIVRANSVDPSADVIVVCDPNDPARRCSLNGELPPLVSLLAASMTEDHAVAVSARVLREQIGRAPDGIGLIGLAMKAAISGNVMFVESPSADPAHTRTCPQLTIPTSAPKALPFRDFLVSLPIPLLNPRSPNTTALRAGLLLLNDYFEESHSQSQSIEGHQYADYWHAILHRREPDYGNAKYWFRHVGRYAIFDQLSSRVSTMMSEATSSFRPHLSRWQPRLIRPGGWDPFAFVDLCEAAETNSDLRRWCEEVQFTEMMLLLVSNYRAAI